MRRLLEPAQLTEGRLAAKYLPNDRSSSTEVLDLARRLEAADYLAMSAEVGLEHWHY